jgi:hypothetical protein
VRMFADKLELNYSGAVFGSYARAYSRAYGMVDNDINKRISELKFATITQVLEPYVHEHRDDFERASALARELAIGKTALKVKK